MWTEIFVDDIEGLEKIIDIDNNFGCAAKLHPTTKETLKRMFSNEDAHAYIYEDNIFQILLFFTQHVGDEPEDDFIQCLRYVIKWDYSNQDINPKEALYIIGIKHKEYLQERKKKWRMPVFSEEKVATLPDQHILDWYGNDIITIYETLGLKATRFETYWIVELM